MDTDRTAAAARFRADNGAGQQDAALAALALHPFDEGAAPGATFAHEVGQRSAVFRREVADVRGNEVGVAAERAIEELLDLARNHREMHYVRVFEDALERAGGPVAAPELGE